MIDSHCHLDFAEFDADRPQVWRNAQAKGLTGLLLPGTQASRFSHLQSIAQQQAGFYYALGLHPWFLNEQSSADLEALEQLLQDTQSDPKRIAIGETGLDFHIAVEPALQLRVFEQHLTLAQHFNLPVIVHHRKSHNDILRLLKRYPDVTGVIHAFSGSSYEAENYVKAGFMLGVGGTITYERANKTRNALLAVGLEHLLLETDAPSMPLHGKQGLRNSPEHLPEIAAVLATLFNQDVDSISRQTTDNFERLFLR